MTRLLSLLTLAALALSARADDAAVSLAWKPGARTFDLAIESTVTVRTGRKPPRAETLARLSLKGRLAFAPEQRGVAPGVLTLSALTVVIDGKKHAFDADRLKGKRATVRRLADGRMPIDFGDFDEDPFDDLDLEEHLGGLLLKLPRGRQALPTTRWRADLDGEAAIFKMRLGPPLKDAPGSIHVTGDPLITRGHTG